MTVRGCDTQASSFPSKKFVVEHIRDPHQEAQLANSSLNVEVAEVIPSVADLTSAHPVTSAAQATIEAARQQINDIIHGQDAHDRMLVLVGPCSIHDPEAAIEYAKGLRVLLDELEDDLVIIMRAYFEKPRTSVGWKGFINDPDLDDTCNMADGLRRARELLVRLNGEETMPTAAEFLSADTARYYTDLVSWTAVGARTTESPAMRELASSLPCAVGFKNTTSGEVQPCLDAMKSAASSHAFLSGNVLLKSRGNPNTHVVMRGGKAGTNYDRDSCAVAVAAVTKAGYSQGRQSVLVDCSHGNSNKKHERQAVVLEDVANQVGGGSTDIMGVMIESNLVEGAQKLSPGVTPVDGLTRGQSVTDACVNIEMTGQMLRRLAEAVRARRDLPHFASKPGNAQC